MASQREVRVCIGRAALPVGTLKHVKDGAREYSAFAYAAEWLTAAERFEVGPDLPLVEGHQVRRAASTEDSVFHHALADTEPDAWGRRVIARAFAKARARHGSRPGALPSLAPLTAMDYLLAVDDEARVGALRLQAEDGGFLGRAEAGSPRTPPLLELDRLFGASRAVEAGTETAADLAYLQGKGTSLGGMRPKCSVIDADGSLAIGKFPSLHDERQVVRGEVLALRLAARAGIEAAKARIETVAGSAVALITRFDRTVGGARIPYLSAASMLQARRGEDRAYTELADAMRARCAEPNADLRQLWRRMVFNLLTSNVDDHLQNLGFLHLAHGQWRLAPAFDLNPFPDKARESKTWLSESAGPVTSVAQLLAHAAHFALRPAAALQVLAEVRRAVAGWRTQAASAAVGLLRREIDGFAPAFEHEAMTEAKRLLA